MNNNNIVSQFLSDDISLSAFSGSASVDNNYTGVPGLRYGMSNPIVSNWGVRPGVYANIGSFAVGDSWSSGLLSSKQNMVVRKTYTLPYKSANIAGYNAQVAYYDGLGAPLQTVDVKYSSDGEDLVTPIDNKTLKAGELRSYLPYPSAGNGELRNTALEQQQSYYTSQYSSAGSKAYTRQVYEVSPQGALKEATQPGFDASVSSKYDTLVQSDAEQVRYFSYDPANNTVSVFATHTFKLIKSVEQNEEGLITETFRNARGIVILSRQRKAGDSSPLADTYYVYDKNDRPVCIVSPEGEAQLDVNSRFTLGSNEYCFFYTYDKKGRLSGKKTPGAAWEYIVYDQGGRIAFTQDGNLRAEKKWMRYAYDKMGRLTLKTVVTGTVSDTRDSLQGKMDAGALITMPLVQTVAEYGYDYNMKYDTRRIDFESGRYLRINGGVILNKPWDAIAPSDPGRIFIGTDNKIREDYLMYHYPGTEKTEYYVFYIPKGYGSITDAFIKAAPSTCSYTTVKPDVAIRTGFELPLASFKSYVDAASNYAFVPVAGICSAADLDPRTRGLKTFESLAVLGSGTESCIRRYFYYDKRGRTIQIVERNAAHGMSRYSMKYDFTGNLLKSNEQHTTVWDASDSKTTTYTYDRFGRVVNEQTDLNGITGSVAYTYDKLGRLLNETIASEFTQPVSIKRTYDIRSRVTSVNSVGRYLQSMTYSPTGNIDTTTIGGGFLANKSTRHAYTYDDLSRLTNEQRGQGSVMLAEFNMSYDRNGNMTSYKRNKPALKKRIEQNYNYDCNKLTSLIRTNMGAVQETDPEMKTLGACAFSYDANGNMTNNSDKNLLLNYNCLNLTNTITDKQTNTKLQYYWLADGTKARTYLYLTETVPEVDRYYIGSLIYDLKTGDVTTGFAGGLIICGATDVDAQIHFKDHLGSIRGIINKNGYAAFNEYEPFGLLDKDYSITTYSGNTIEKDRNRFLFNGKEQNQTSKSTSASSLLDYGARMYDPVIGRWNATDPLADKYWSFSPYNYCVNNPVKYIDIEGKSPWPVNPTFKGKGRKHSNDFNAPRPNGRTHKGIDINFMGGGDTDYGAPIYATHNGFITRMRTIGDDKDAGGNRIAITSLDGSVETRYMHLSEFEYGLFVGDFVYAGQLLGYMGKSGKGELFSYVSHLHYEILYNGKAINPAYGSELIDPVLLGNGGNPYDEEPEDLGGWIRSYKPAEVVAKYKKKNSSQKTNNNSATAKKENDDGDDKKRKNR